jgi:hypothetical protein
MLRTLDLFDVLIISGLLCFFWMDWVIFTMPKPAPASGTSPVMVSVVLKN